MNRKKFNGSKTSERSLLKVKDECESDSTDSFDMNDFKSSSLTKKYSVPIHKNKADLMAELSSINIMGDESDVEIVEPRNEQNGLNTSNVSDANSSKITGTYTSNSSDAAVNGELANVKKERLLSWAQSLSQNLSTRVESILSDHDYLSQEHLIGIITGNEENTEPNNGNEINGEINGNMSTEEPDEKLIDSQATILYSPSELNGNVTHSDSERFAPKNINEFNVILTQLTDSKKHEQSLSLLAAIEEKAKQFRMELTDKKGNASQMPNTQNGSNETTPEFSINHSEPLEYYGPTLSTESTEEPKESQDNDMVLVVRNDLKTVDDMANRIKVDTQLIQNKLTEVEKQPEADRPAGIEKLRENFALLVKDMANELTKIALKLRPNAAQTETDSSSRKLSDKMPKDRLVSESTDYDSDSYRKSRKLKRRRKLRRSQADVSDSSNLSSTSKNSRLHESEAKKFRSEPEVISQDMDEILEAPGSNKSNESISKENDFIGFEDVDEIDIGIKTEVMLNSESMSSQNATISQKTDTNTNTKQTLNVSDQKSSECITINTSNESKADESNNSAIQELDQSSSADSDNDRMTPTLEDDDEDEEIRKLLDLTSIESRRVASTQSAARANGIVDPKKPMKKVPKEDPVAKILANSDDTENQIESDTEKSEHEEYITEEQYLKEQNLLLKEQMLQDSSESEHLDSDSDEQLNGKANDFYTDSDDDKTSDSNQSLMEKFLASDSMSNDDKSPVKDKKKDEKPKDSKNLAVSDEKPEPKTKEEPKPKVETEKADRIDDAEMDSDIEFDSESESLSFSGPSRKSKSTVGKNVFSSIEKEARILIPSDDEEASGSELKKKRSEKPKNEADSSGNNSETVDTSSFKSSKKDLNPQQLSRIIMQSNRNKQSTTRVSPECISVSSDDDIEIEPSTTEKKDGNDDDEEGKEKRGKRKLLTHDQLADDTKLAQREESDRIKRLDKKNERLSQFMESQRSSQSDSEGQTDLMEVVLDVNSKKNEKVVVHPEITKHLKAHQVEGIKFMYDCCYGSVDNIEKFPGSGCILAHCMGLGKTLQLITLLHTVITNKQLKTDKVLVICPKSTVMNWKDEIERWLSPIKNTRKLKLFHFPEASDINQKLITLKDWSQCGKDGNKQAGCLLLGYEAFRVLVGYHSSKKSQSIYTADELEKLRKSIHKYILDPGADLVVCDEGHMIKNQKSSTSLSVNQIMTRRRIVLTGTPIQNNLKEYYSMVNFIKPSFLGTEKEFANLYVNPIKNGQHKDSSNREIKHMKQRSYVLHKKLSRFVQRREAALLKSFLPDKFEFVLFIPMTKVQTELYEFFLENRPNQDQKGKSLIPDYTVLRKIWTHPKVMEKAYLNALNNKAKIKPTVTTNANDSDDDQPDDVFDSQTGKMSVTSDWWRQHLTQDDLETILPSNKLKVLFEILNLCRRNKEKCLIFSAFVAVLDVVEFFMRLISDQEKDGNKPGLETYRGPWINGQDYYRLDGKTAKNQRHSMITNFNDPKNERVRVFLISARAGGQGINLIGANRVILLDTSWNPSNDQQNIFRVFRLGQKRVCYIYRLLSMGTMEEKVYSRSVTKQAMSCRVMDEQQIDRHYNMAELTELYTLTKPEMSERPTPNVPRDDVLAFMLMKFPHMVYKYHEHDSLLENKGEEELSEQEKNDAWTAYEMDVKRKNESNMGPYNNSFGMLPNYSGIGTYANSLFNNYNNLSGVSGLNYPYNMYGQYANPYASEYNQMRFSDFSAFYNNLMNVGSTSMTNYNQSNSNLMSPNHSTSVSSPPPIMNMNNFPSSRNWMQSNASSSSLANSLLSSFAQSSSSSKSSYSSYLNSIYNALGTNTVPPPPTTATASAEKSPPLPLTTPTAASFDPLTYHQKQHMTNVAGSNPISSTSSQASSLSAGPNAIRNPLLTKELLIPRNPIMSSSKDAYNLPIPTSVITKSTTNSTSPLPSQSAAGGSNSNDTSKTSSKAPDSNISSTVDKTATKSSKSNADSNQLIIKDVKTINNESRDSPDTTAANQASNKSTDKTVSNGVTSSMSKILTEAMKKTTKTTATPISSNMGIVYPPKQAQASTSKTSPNSSVLVTTNTKAAKEKDAARKSLLSSSAVTINKTSNQPMPTIIRKSFQSGTKGSDATNDAVAAINKNKALTVTARSVATSASKTPVTDVNNSITLSPIPNPIAKFTGGGVTITPQVIQTKASTPSHGRTQSPLLKTNIPSPVPVALSKVNANQTQKPPTTVGKTNVLSSRNTNTFNTFKPTIVTAKSTSNAASPIPISTRIVNQSASPKILVSRTSSLQSSDTYKPIIAQTKAKVLSEGQALLGSTQIMKTSTANNSGLQVNRVITKVRPTPQQTIVKAIVNNKMNDTGIDVRKRLSSEPISFSAKKPKAMINVNSTASTSGPSKQQNPLQGIRINPRTNSQQANSLIAPVEIVELE